MWWVQGLFLSLGSWAVIPGWMHPPLLPELLLSGTGSDPSSATASRNLLPSTHWVYLGLPLLPYILEWQNHFECFSYRCPSRVWFSGTKNSLTLTAAQIILQLHPALLHPTLIPAKPLLEFPLSLIVLSYSPWLLTEVNSFSPNINRNQQVKKFCLMWH